MKTDQQFWEDIVASLAPAIIRETLVSEKLIMFLAQEKRHASNFAAELAAMTADELLLLRNRRMGVEAGRQESPVEESAATS
jgi:hypothetical protein